MTRPIQRPSGFAITTDDDYRKAGLVPPTESDRIRFAQPLSPALPPPQRFDAGAEIIEQAISLGFNVLGDFLKSWMTPSTPVHGGSKPIYGHTGELIKLWIYNPDDYVTIMINDKMVGGASIGQTVEVVAGTIKEGLNLVVGKLENSGAFEWGIDLAARRDGHDWASEIHVGGNEGIFKTSHLILIQVYGQ